MLHALVHPQPPHQLTDLVRQLNLVPLRGHLEEQPRVLLKVNFDYPYTHQQFTMQNDGVHRKEATILRGPGLEMANPFGTWLRLMTDYAREERGRENRLAKAKE